MSFLNERGREFLGSGISFPFKIDREGRMVMSSLEDHIRESIILILNTAKGERVMRPDFGCGLQELVFSNIDASTTALVKHEVEEALIRFEPRIDLINVQVMRSTEQKNVLDINIEYRVRKTDSMFNIVYPFYLERGIK